MDAHVICMNDSVEAVVLDNIAFALAKMTGMKRAYYDSCPGQYTSYGDYLEICFWHIHTVKVLE